jgi:hemoglobin-like flavoprotein
MSPAQIDLVQSSFRKVQPISDTAAQLFYRRLFELDPTLAGLFKGDMKEQGRKLMSMIAVAVGGLKSLDKLLPAVQALGRRHKGYGVKPAHYDTVGAALIWTLAQGLQEEFTEDVKAAWVETYTVLSTTMKNAANAA